MSGRRAGVCKVGRLVGGAALLVLVLCAAAPFSSAAGGGAGTLTMDDGTPIAYDLVLPEGSPPAGGWPAVILAFGGEMDESLGQVFTDRGYAALLYVTRGHPGSGGVADFAGPRDVADFRASFGADSAKSLTATNAASSLCHSHTDLLKEGFRRARDVVFWRNHDTGSTCRSLAANAILALDLGESRGVTTWTPLLSGGVLCRMPTISTRSVAF